MGIPTSHPFIDGFSARNHSFGVLLFMETPLYILYIYDMYTYMYAYIYIYSRFNLSYSSTLVLLCIVGGLVPVPVKQVNEQSIVKSITWWLIPQIVGEF